MINDRAQLRARLAPCDERGGGGKSGVRRAQPNPDRRQRISLLVRVAGPNFGASLRARLAAVAAALCCAAFSPAYSAPACVRLEDQLSAYQQELHDLHVLPLAGPRQDAFLARLNAIHPRIEIRPAMTVIITSPQSPAGAIAVFSDRTGCVQAIAVFGPLDEYFPDGAP